MKKLIPILIIGAVIIGILTWLLLKPTSSTPSAVSLPTPTNIQPSTAKDYSQLQLRDSIRQQLAQKYQRPTSSVDINILQVIDSYARGEVRFADEPGGAIWFAAMINNHWQVVADGQGPLSCEVVDKFNLPSSIVSSCLDSDGNLQSL